MLTEEQAREKWCPMARVVEVFEGLHGPFNRYHPGSVANSAEAENPPGCHCIASKCMAWRWGRVNREQSCLEETGLTRDQWMTRHQRTVGGNAQDAYDTFCRTFNTPTHGYCGAFGTPGEG